MRLSRVPVLSLCRRVLVYDPGGLRTTRPSRRADSAFQSHQTVRASLGKGSGIPSSAYPEWDHNFRHPFEAPYRPRQLA